MKSMLITLGIALSVFPSTGVRADPADPDSVTTGAVYTMDNAATGNRVWAFERRTDGSLSKPKTYRTRGLGTGGGLGNQGGVLLSRDGRWLFVCNAGSDEISVFADTGHGLFPTHKVNSQGRQPISLTLHRNLLYVLNAGGSTPGGADNVAGFLFLHGRLIPLPGSVRTLSANNTGPAQVAFTRDGCHLLVTEKTTGLIDVFSIEDGGFISALKSFISPAPPPFGFAAGWRDRIYVTQAAGGAGNPGASSVSSYQVTHDGELEVISESVPTFQTAACWLILTRNERFAYTANTPNDSISSFLVDCDGNLALLESQAASTAMGSGPVDMALSRDNHYLYSLNPGNGTISSFQLDIASGSLEPILSTASVPTTANGLAAR